MLTRVSTWATCCKGASSGELPTRHLSNSQRSSVGRGRQCAVRAPPLPRPHRAGITLQVMAGSWGLHAQQSIGWPRAPTGNNSNPTAAVTSVPKERGILLCIFTCFQTLLAAEGYALRLLSCSRTAGSLQLLGSSKRDSSEIAVLESAATQPQWLGLAGAKTRDNVRVFKRSRMLVCGWFEVLPRLP